MRGSTLVLLFSLLQTIIGEEFKWVEYEYDIPLIKELVSFESNNTILRVSQNDVLYPIQLGKTMTYMASRDYKDVRLASGDVKVIFEQSQNPQFLFFRTPGSIPYDGEKSYLSPGTNITVEYKRTSNIFSIFQEGGTEMADPNGESIPGFVGFARYRVLPGESRLYLLKRFIDVYQSTFWFGLDMDTTFELQSKLLDFYEALFESNLVTFDENEPYDHIQELVTYRGDFEPQDLNGGKVLYANSDESFHLWTENFGTEAYIVDIGNLFLSNGLDAVMKDSWKVRDLFIIPTHFHQEHIQCLASFINRTNVRKMTLVVSEGLLLEFMGWYLENYDHIISKVIRRQLRVVVAGDDEWVKLGSLEIKMLLSNRFPDPRIKHFISNSSPVLRDCHGENYRIFSGDLQSPVNMWLPEEEFFPILYNSFAQIFEAAEIPGSASIDYYFGIGLFYWQMMLYPWQLDEDWRVTPAEFLDFVYSSFPDYPGLEMVFIHVTTADGFSVALRDSFLKD